MLLLFFLGNSSKVEIVSDLFRQELVQDIDNQVACNMTNYAAYVV